MPRSDVKFRVIVHEDYTAEIGDEYSIASIADVDKPVMGVLWIEH
jgi:hypothetical protein